MKFLPSSLSLGLIAAAVATLTACGGGGGSSTNANGSLVTGVAATGLAIDHGQVTLSCTSGSTNPVTTAMDGTFSVDVSSVSLPCVARVDYTDTTGRHKLHSLVRTAGHVNITPVTDMVVASLSATGVAADVDANEVESYTDARISTATRQVETHLESKGISTANLPIDVIGTKFEAAHGSNHGDAHDSVLDEIKGTLETSQQTLEEVENELHGSHESDYLGTSTGQTGDAVAGKASYDAMCSTCHGSGISDARNAANTLEAIAKNKGGMGSLRTSVTQMVADNIATYLTYGVGAGTTTGTSTGTPPTTPLTTQTIAFTAPGAQTLGTTPAALIATASSNLPVNIASSTPGVCSVNTTALTLLAAGNCTLTASQAGNATFAAAPAQVVTFAVTDPNATGTTPPATTPPGTTPVGLIPDAAAGKALYTQCSGCHGAAAAGGIRVLNGANSAITILNAITTNMGGMRSLSSLTNQNLADIAAYLATPTI